MRFPAVMRTPIVDHPLRASWRTNLLFPVFPRPGPRDPEDKYGGKAPGTNIDDLEHSYYFSSVVVH